MLQALLTQDPGLTRQLTAALPPGTQLGSNATMASEGAAAGAIAAATAAMGMHGAHAQGPSAEAGDEKVVEKRSASMLLGWANSAPNLLSVLHPPLQRLVLPVCSVQEHSPCCLTALCAVCADEFQGNLPH